jgi:hypothetical protein
MVTPFKAVIVNSQKPELQLLSTTFTVPVEVGIESSAGCSRLHDCSAPADSTSHTDNIDRCVLLNLSENGKFDTFFIALFFECEKLTPRQRGETRGSFAFG